MFLRFEGPKIEQTVECKKYRLEMGKNAGEKLVFIDDETTGWVVHENEDRWNTVYIMNSDGMTIDTIHSHPLAALAEVSTG